MKLNDIVFIKKMNKLGKIVKINRIREFYRYSINYSIFLNKPMYTVEENFQKHELEEHELELYNPNIHWRTHDLYPEDLPAF